LIINKRDKLLDKPGEDHQYTFGGVTTDHMLHCDYDMDNGGWQPPRIEPLQDFELDPSNATLHYSIECFEGAKAYIHAKDDTKLVMYRINKNFERMNSSHRQLGFPQFNVDEMVKCTEALLDLDREWMPRRPMHSMYIRPNSICMDNRLGISKI